MIQNVSLIATILRKRGGGLSPTWSIFCTNAKRTDLEQKRIITHNNYKQKRRRHGIQKSSGCDLRKKLRSRANTVNFQQPKANLCTKEQLGSHTKYRLPSGRAAGERPGAQRQVHKIPSTRLQEEKKDKQTCL